MSDPTPPIPSPSPSGAPDLTPPPAPPAFPPATAPPAAAPGGAVPGPPAAAPWVPPSAPTPAVAPPAPQGPPTVAPMAPPMAPPTFGAATPAFAGPPPAGPPLIPPTGPVPSGEAGRPRGTARGAVMGAIAGALVAALVAGVLVLVTRGDGDRVSATSVSMPSRPANTIAGKPLDIQALLAKVRPSVVSIQTDTEFQRTRSEAAGSGIVLDDAGLVLTNAHVVGGATSITVAFADGTNRPATLVGSFPDDDVALVKADVSEPTTPAELGSSDALLVGDDVVAIGNALNLGAQPSVTKGIVSAKDRSIAAEGVQLDQLIQTDAAINPGNSGGPLVNAEGQVVGMNTAIIQDSQNVGFSLAIDAIRPLIEQIKAGKGDVDGDSAFLGVSTLNISEVTSDVLDRSQVQTERGAFVAGVQSGTGADQAGLREGDVITKIDGAAVDNKEDVGAAIRKKSPGDEVSIEYQRAGRTESTTATLGRRGG